MIDIVNHSVRVKDIGLLNFLYPEFKVLDRPVLFIDSPIIYIGDTKYINQIKDLGVPYIIVCTLAEYDLTDRHTLLELAFSKYNKEIPKYVKEFENDLDDYEIQTLIEYLWITGKWPLKTYDNVGKFLKLVQSFNTDTVTIAKTYLELLNETTSEYIETSLLTFLNRILKVNNYGISAWYSKVLKEYSSNKKEYIEKAINNYIDSDIQNHELKIFNLILDLNRNH